MIPDAYIERARSLVQGKGDLILTSVAGSRAYGLERPDSDWDIRGVYIAPKDQFLGVLEKPKLTLSYKGDDLDLVIYELGHFVSLAGRGNPSINEILWSPCVTMAQEGEKLVTARRAFLSYDMVETFTGFAKSQMKRASYYDAIDAPEKARKCRLHALRVALSLGHLMLYGTIEPRAQYPDVLRILATAPSGEAEAMLENILCESASYQKMLKDSADWDALNRLVLDLRG